MNTVIRVGRWLKWKLMFPLLGRWPRVWRVVEPIRYQQQRDVLSEPSSVRFIYNPGELVRIAADLRESLGAEQAERWLEHLQRRCRNFEDTLQLALEALHKDELDRLRERIIDTQCARIDQIERVIALEKLGEAQRARHEGRLSDALKLVEELGQLPDHLEHLPHRLREMLRVIEEGARSLWPLAQGPVEAGDGPVLLGLHNSLPFDRAGYALRTQMLLTSLNDLGEDAKACTRPGYPWDLQAHRGKRKASSSEHNGVTYTRLDPGPYPYNLVPDSEYVAQYARQLLSHVEAGRPRAIHGVSNYLNGLAAIAAARQLHVPAIYEMRGLWHYSRAARDPEFRRTELYDYQSAMEQFAAQEADAVITISKALSRHLVEEWGIPENKITVVPNAVDVDLFRPLAPDREIRERLGMNERFIVGFIGSLTAYEGLDDLIQAVARLDDHAVGLVIVGDGRARADLEDLTQELGCADRVRFTGGVPFEDVRRYYSCFDVCAYPRKNVRVSRYVPPLKPLEAMAMGLPLIISDVPPLLELVDGGNFAYVSPAGDVPNLAAMIDRIRRSSESRATLGEAGRTWVQANRSWRASAVKIREVYSTLSQGSCERAYPSAKV